MRPHARRAALGGMSPDGAALVIAVAAPPEQGRANEAVREALAAALGVAASAVTLRRGATGRRKTFAIAGDPAILGPKIERLAS